VSTRRTGSVDVQFSALASPLVSEPHNCRNQAIYTKSPLRWIVSPEAECSTLAVSIHHPRNSLTGLEHDGEKVHLTR
jgi:hypothetical protein